MIKTEELKEEQYRDIVKTADHIASILLIQLYNSSPESSAALQLGLIKTLSVLWAAQAKVAPEVIFDGIMATLPNVFKYDTGVVH